MRDPWPVLQTLIESALRSQELEPIAVYSADHDADGTFARDAGFAAALDALRRAFVDGDDLSAILLIGVLPFDEVRARLVHAVGTGALLDWAGLRYLRYIFTEDDLRSAASEALSGRNAPVPLPTPHEVLVKIETVLHWLERVRQSQFGTARIFADVARGTLSMPRRSLEPEPCLSAEHRDGLDGLCDMLRLAIEYDDGPKMEELLRTDIAAIEEQSEELEKLKALHFASQSSPDTTELEILAEAARKLDRRAMALYDHLKGIADSLRGKLAGDNG